VKFSGEHSDIPGCSGRRRGEQRPGTPAICRMSLFDLIKATVVCGVVAFLFYSFPILGQIMAITVMSVLWLSYARKTVVRVRSSQTPVRVAR